MKFIRDLLSETGSISATRFVQVVGLFMALGIAIKGMSDRVDMTGLSILCLSFIIPQTIAKVMQKKLEAGNDSKTETK
jgi:hypothetical protein